MKSVKISNKMIKEARRKSAESNFLVFDRCITDGIFTRLWRGVDLYV